MLAPFVRAIMEHGKAKDPKAYKVIFVHRLTLLGKQRGEGWYILTPKFQHIGPVDTQERAENILFSALEELRKKAFTPEERQKAHEFWEKK